MVRRAFAAVILACTCSPIFAVAGVAPEPADRIWTNATVLTMNDAAMRAVAVAERGGKIVAVGSADDLMKFRGEGTEVRDLAGKTLVPGFIDSHGHMVAGGLQALAANLLAAPDGKVDSVPALQQTLRDWLAANGDAARKANLVVGFGYDNAQLKELRHPTRDDLDAVSTELPIIVIHQSSHLAVLNSKALEVVGYTATTKNPPGGVIRRRPGTDEPDGYLEETAFINALFKLAGNIGPEGVRAFARAGADLWARYGYTTAQDGRSSPGMVKVLRSIADEGGFQIDVVSYIDVMMGRDDALRARSREYANRFRVGGVKLGIDGSPQGFTAWRDKPYHKPVGDYPPGYSGYGNVTREQVTDAVEWAFANDVQILAHAAGEAASDALIAALRAATERHGRADRRPVLIHGHFLREDQVDAYRDLDVVPSLFPMHTFYWGDWHREHTLGPRYADDLTPTGWFLRRGVPFTSHHDAPVAFPDSMRILDATVTRRSRSGDIIGPDQRVDVISGLKSLTIWAARQYFEERTKGSIEVGKRADLVVLSADPTAVDPETIDQIRVLETIKDGRTVFALTPAEQRRTQLMPGATPEGQAGFARFLASAAAYREYARLPDDVRRRPYALPYVMRASEHNKGCVTNLLTELTEAMLENDPARR